MSDDLIKRSDAIKAITYSHLNVLTKEERVLLIQGIPSADRSQEWIPCSERLPEKDGFYLTTITDGDQITVCKLPFAKSEWRGNWFDDEVLAWMPLPEPWKGADDEASD